MRFIVHIVLPVGKFNEALRDVSAAKKIGRILEDTKPEAAYFGSNDGKRGGYLVVNISNPSEMPRLAEPWYITFDASVEFMPVMTPEDLQKSGLEDLARKWARSPEGIAGRDRRVAA